MSKNNRIRRREFVLGLSQMAAVPLALSRQAEAAGKALDIKSVTASQFQPYVGQKFKAGLAEVILDRIDVPTCSDQRKRIKGVRQAPFSLIFTAPTGSASISGVTQLEHKALGRFELFLTRIRLTSTFSSASAVGQAERLVTKAVNSVKKSQKDYFEAPFN